MTWRSRSASPPAVGADEGLAVGGRQFHCRVEERGDSLPARLVHRVSDVNGEASAPQILFSRRFELAKEKRPREGPSPLQRRWRNVERLGRFLHREPAEEPELDEPSIHRIHRGETLQRLIERQHVDRSFRRWQQALVKRHAFAMSAPLGRVPRPRALDQDLAHQARRDAEEVRPVARSCGTASEAQPCFVHESRRIECLTGPFAAHLRVRDSPQLLVDEGQQRIDGAFLTGTRCSKKRRDGTTPAARSSIISGFQYLPASSS